MLSENYSIILALLTAIAAGLVGAFALMKKMTLAGDVISHIALPGLGLALLLKVNPIIGGAVTLFLGTLLIARLEGSTKLPSETAIGVIFAGALALGALVTPSEDLIEALFGPPGGGAGLNAFTFALGTLAAILVIWFILAYRDKLVLALFSPELADSSGVELKKLNLAYLLIFSLTVLLGLRFLGAILVGSLIIIPAAIGRQLTKTLTSFLIVSSASSALAMALGFLITSIFPSLVLGPVVVTIATAFFLLSLIKK